MRTVPVTPPLGGFDGGVAASEQAPGTYSSGVNVRSVDPRSKRRRLARRPGLTRLGSGTVAVAGDEVTALFKVGRDTQDDRYRLLTTSTQAGVTPDKVEAEWEVALGAEPLAIAASPDGRNAYVLLATGAVAVVNAAGTVEQTIPSQRPVNFQTVEAIGVDELGGVLMAYAYARQINGAAGVLVRMVKSADGAWTRSWAQNLAGTPVHFVYRASVLYVALQRPSNVETGPLSSVIRVTGATTGLPVQLWETEVAHPVIRLAVNEKGDVFVASRPNADRPVGTTSAVGSPSVSWTPMEPVTTHVPLPAENLYWWTSAERMATEQGVYDNATIERWVDSRRDPSDWDPVIDVEPTTNATGRGFVTLTVTGTPQLAPVMDADAVGDKPGVYFNGTAGAAVRLVSLTTYGNAEKAAGDGYAPHQRTVLPTMRDAGNLGATFITTWLCRVQNWTDGAVALTDWKVIFQQGDYVLKYRRGGGGATDLEVGFDVPGVPVGMTATTNVTVGADTDLNTLLFSFRHSGIGATTSEWWVNGVIVGSDFEMTSYSDETPTSTVIGGPRPGSSLNGMRGHILEIVTMLGATASDPHDTQPTTANGTDTTRARLEGFVSYRYGLDAVLPGAHFWNASAPTGTGDTQLNVAGFGVSEQTGLLIKYNSAGEPQWWLGGNSYGNGVACGPGDVVYAIGTPLPGSSGSTIRVRRLRDNGDTVVESGSTVWSVAAQWEDQWARPGVDLFVDAYGNLYLPWALAGTGGARNIRRYRRDGNGLGTAVNDWTLELNTTANTDEVPIGFAGIGQPIEISAAVSGYESLWVISQNDSYQIRRIAVLGTLDAPRESTREVSLCAVTASGSLRRLVDGTWTELVAGAFTGTRPWAATVYPYTVLGDGVNPYRVLDHRSMQVRAFEGSTKGEVPPRSPIGFAWRRRVGVVNAQSRHQLALSAFGDVFDWDPARDVVTSTQAVTSRFSAAAEYPDLIRNVAPWNDDLAIVMCDGSIWRQTGDPMTGGQQDQVARDIGLADDWAWCLSPQGALFLLGTDRHVWMMAPSGEREPITRGTMWATLCDIDLAVYRVEMRWSIREDALWLVVIPRTGTAIEAQHFVWERSVQAWHPQVFSGGANRVVTAVGTFDGDSPDDAALLVGFADGAVRRVDQYALDDDGLPIPSSVTIGPLVGGSAGVESQLVFVDVSPALDGAALTIGARGSSFADAPGPVRRSLDAPVGRASRLPINLRAPYLWLDVTGRGGPWALEGLQAAIIGGEPRRMR